MNEGARQFSEDCRRTIAAAVEAGLVHYPGTHKMPPMPRDRQAKAKSIRDDNWMMLCKECGATWYDTTPTCPKCLSPYVRKLRSGKCG